MSETFFITKVFKTEKVKLFHNEINIMQESTRKMPYFNGKTYIKWYQLPQWFAHKVSTPQSIKNIE